MLLILFGYSPHILSVLLAEIFYVFQNFKREEQNFVVQNEINNMSFLISDTKSKMSKVA